MLVAQMVMFITRSLLMPANSNLFTAIKNVGNSKPFGTLVPVAVSKYI